MHRGTLAVATATLALLGASAPGQVTGLPEGYSAATLVLPEPPTGSVCADANDPDAFYISAGSFGDTRIYRVKFTTGFNHETPKLVAGGAQSTFFRYQGNNVLNTGFGSVWMTSLVNGALIVVDNDLGLSGAGPGEAVYFFRDLNRDRDFRDIRFFRQSEAVTVTNAPIGTTGDSGNFTGAGAAVSALGELFIPTSDGPGAGEVIRIVPQALQQKIYYAPLDYGSGAVVRPDGWLAVGNTDGTFAAGSIVLLRDGNGDGDAMDPGESQIIPTPPVYDLTQTGSGASYRMAVSTNGFPSRVQLLQPDNTLQPFATLSIFATGLSFDSSTGRSFEPFASGPRQRLLVTDLNSSTFEGQCHVIMPIAP